VEGQWRVNSRVSTPRAVFRPDLSPSGRRAAERSRSTVVSSDAPRDRLTALVWGDDSVARSDAGIHVTPNNGLTIADLARRLRAPTSSRYDEDHTFGRRLVSDFEARQLTDDLGGQRIQRRHSVADGITRAGEIDHKGAA
jgi:hypothetical protein